MLFGYARANKSDAKWVLARQRDALLRAGVTPDYLFSDRASGKHNMRSGMEACLKGLQLGDTLFVSKLYCLSSDLHNLVELIHELACRRVNLVTLTGPRASLNIAAGGGRSLMGVFASLNASERKHVADLTRARLALVLLSEGGGRPLKMTVSGLLRAQAEMGQPGTKVIKLCDELGVTRETLYRHVAPDGRLRPDGERLLENSRNAEPRQPSQNGRGRYRRLKLAWADA